MSQYTTLEEYANHVRRETMHLMGALCHTLGAEHPAAAKAAELCTEAAGIVQQSRMKQETTATNRYDLAALRVAPDTASHSETPFEND